MTLLVETSTTSSSAIASSTIPSSSKTTTTITITNTSSTNRPVLKHSTSDVSNMTQKTEETSSSSSSSTSPTSSPSSSDTSDDSSIILDGRTQQLLQQHLQYCQSTSSLITKSQRKSCMSSSRRSNSNVSFGSIKIRDYERIPGDHPETSIGVPLTIGWAYKERPNISITKWEKQKMDTFLEDDTAIVLKTRKPTGGCGGASGNVKRLGAMTRKRLLMDEFNISLQDILKAEKDVDKFKKQLEKQRHAELHGYLLDDDEEEDNDNKKKKNMVRSLRKGVMNKLSLRTPSNKKKKNKNKSKEEQCEEACMVEFDVAVE